MSHQITVTKNDVPTDADLTYQHTAVVDSCDGVGCELYAPCSSAAFCGEVLRRDPFLPGPVEMHGVEHRLMNGRWLVNAQLCALVNTDGGHDRLIDFGMEHGPGTYTTTVKYEGGEYWGATVVDAD